VRAYSASSQEALHARDLLRDWRGQDLLTAGQFQRMEPETFCDLRRTNIFLRLVLFLFTLIIVGAGVGLFFTMFFSRPGERTIGVFLLIFAGLFYAAAEIAVSQARLYRYGIEEALLAASVASLWVGIALSSGFFTSSYAPEFLVPAAGVVASLWIWHRFGLPYAFLAALLFTAWLSTYATSSPSGQHAIVAASYAAGLAVLAAVRPRYRLTYLHRQYSIAEALLWLGVYLAFNLQLSSLNLLQGWWTGSPSPSEFSRLFYWATWVLIWCLPPLVLARGLRQKDRWVMAAGAIAAILTLITNKPYLGWQRYTWDPMLLGAFLTGVAILLRRWLAKGPGGIRHGFTAQRLSAKDKSWINAGVSTIGLAAPNIVTPTPKPDAPGVHFGGGDSGGGGATSDF